MTETAVRTVNVAIIGAGTVPRRWGRCIWFGGGFEHADEPVSGRNSVFCEGMTGHVKKNQKFSLFLDKGVGER